MDGHISIDLLQTATLQSLVTNQFQIWSYWYDLPINSIFVANSKDFDIELCPKCYKNIMGSIK